MVSWGQFQDPRNVQRKSLLRPLLKEIHVSSQVHSPLSFASDLLSFRAARRFVLDSLSFSYILSMGILFLSHG